MSGFPDPEEALEISPEAVSALLRSDPGSFALIDCREDDELAICKITGAAHLALSAFPDAALAYTSAADADLPVVVYCHHGMRSQHAALFLRQAGVKNTFSMAGGIEAWSVSIDPSVARY